MLTQVLQVRPKSVSVKQPNTSSYYEMRDWKLGAGPWPRPEKGRYSAVKAIRLLSFVSWLWYFSTHRGEQCKSKKISIGSS